MRERGSYYLSQENIIIGSIAGKVSSDTEVNYCFWTSDTNSTKMIGVEKTGVHSTESRQIEITLESVKMINEHATRNDTCGKWILNSNNNLVTFKLSDRNEYSFSTQLILLPSFSGDNDRNSTFSGWFTDSSFLDETCSLEVAGNTSFYGLYGNIFTLNLDLNYGEDAASWNMKKAVLFNSSYGDFPKVNRTGHTFVGWFTDKTHGELVTKESTFIILDDQTLYAHWEINNYIVTFDFSNGTEPEKRVYSFNDSIDYPK